MESSCLWISSRNLIKLHCNVTVSGDMTPHVPCASVWSMHKSCMQQKGIDACPRQNKEAHLYCPYLDRFSLHSHGQALLVPTILAPVPLSLVDGARPLLPTGIRQVLAHRPFEEALAAFATAGRFKLASLQTVTQLLQYQEIDKPFALCTNT